jgi:DNA-binding beta-propeller fold protein YncE
VSRVIDAPGVASYTNGIAVSVDGCTLLVSDGIPRGAHAIHEFSVVDGSLRRVIGDEGDGALQFKEPRQLCIAPDGFVFVADTGSSRMQVLTPTLYFDCFIGQGQLERPVGVCANADVVVVSEFDAHCVSVFRRGDGSLLRRFGSKGSGDGQLSHPCGLCFMSGDRHVAVASLVNSRVSVLSIDGEFIRHVSVRVLRGPQGVAASDFDELVVADTGNRCLRVFSGDGDVLSGAVKGRFVGVAVHGSSVMAVECVTKTVSVIT